MTQTAVVILNYNGRDYLEKFLPHLIDRTNDARIVIADNASTDSSVEFLKAEYPQIERIIINENLGYSGGYNYALERVSADYFILLNSDIEVTEGWVAPLIAELDKSEVVACQPKILQYHNKGHFEYAGAAGGYIDYLGYPFCRGRVFDNLEEDQGQYDDNVEVFWATGACLMIRSDIFSEMGGFDKEFFAHMEEIDLCWRIQKAGYKISYVPESRVFHVGGGTLDKTKPHKTFLNYRNGLAMLYKNTESNKLFVLIFTRLILDGISALRLLLSGSFSHFAAILKAHFHFYQWLPQLSRKRKAFRSKVRRKNSQINTIHSRSIVWNFFIRGKKKYSELN